MFNDAKARSVRINAQLEGPGRNTLLTQRRNDLIAEALGQQSIGVQKHQDITDGRSGPGVHLNGFARL